MLPSNILTVEIKHPHTSSHPPQLDDSSTLPLPHQNLQPIATRLQPKQSCPKQAHIDPSPIFPDIPSLLAFHSGRPWTS